jgi:hypothetical protein
MAFLDRSQIVRTSDRAPLARVKELFAGILIVALIATVGIRNVVPADALAPAIVTLLFAVAAVTAGFALLCPRPIPHNVVRPRRKPDVHRRRPDRAGSDDQAFHPVAST